MIVNQSKPFFMQGLRNKAEKKDAPKLGASFFIFIKGYLNTPYLYVVLNRKTFSTTTGSDCIGVIKVKAFTIQSTRKVKYRIAEVQKAF